MTAFINSEIEHESHISALFAAYSMNNDILLILLLAHSSHLLQSLDVSIFGSLKKMLSKSFSKLFDLGVHRIKKYEWTLHYAQAHQIAISVINIHGG